MHSSLTDGRKQLGAHAPLLAEQVGLLLWSDGREGREAHCCIEKGICKPLICNVCVSYCCMQWCKVRSLKASVELLSEVSALAALPDQVEAALMRKDWPEAVRMVRQGQQALARPDLRKVGHLGSQHAESARVANI